MSVNIENHPDREEMEGRALRSVTRNAPYREMFSSRITDNHTVYDGDLIVDCLPAIHLDADRIERVIRKMIKGLWFLCTETIIPQKATMDIRLDPSPEAANAFFSFFSSDPWYGFEDGTFLYKVQSVTDARSKSVWLLLFNCVYLIVVVVDYAPLSPKPAS